jgi:hypothetical protein
MTIKKLPSSKRSWYIIKCECGEEIAFLPDVKAMGNTIEVHVDLHMLKLKVPACNEEEAKRLRDDLITQVLSLASQSENDEP